MSEARQLNLLEQRYQQLEQRNIALGEQAETAQRALRDRDARISDLERELAAARDTAQRNAAEKKVCCFNC